MSKLSNTPQPVREAIAFALFVAAITATAANMFQQPLFLLGGVILFAIFYFWRLAPQIKAAYEEQSETQAQYDDDETYQPILDRFYEDKNDEALVDQYRAWSQGPHTGEVKLRFLQEAVLSLIDAKRIYRVEDLMTEMEQIAASEGLTDRFTAYRAECDRRIAEIAQQRLAEADAEVQAQADAEAQA